ncbi:MAG: hypothetical protein ACRDHC_09645, partial [Actinomycetota bacterium]
VLLVGRLASSSGRSFIGRAYQPTVVAALIMSVLLEEPGQRIGFQRAAPVRHRGPFGYSWEKNTFLTSV